VIAATIVAIAESRALIHSTRGAIERLDRLQERRNSY
jgi:hypothetical protein